MDAKDTGLVVAPQLEAGCTMNMQGSWGKLGSNRWTPNWISRWMAHEPIKRLPGVMCCPELRHFGSSYEIVPKEVIAF